MCHPSVDTISVLPRQGGDDADQIAFRVFEPRSLASIRRLSDAVLSLRLGGVVLLEGHAPGPSFLGRWRERP